MGVEGSEATVPMRNSRKPRLILAEPSMWPSRYSSGSRTSTTTTGSPASSRFLSSAGPCSGMTCLASASICLSVFMSLLLHLGRAPGLSTARPLRNLTRGLSTARSQSPSSGLSVRPDYQHSRSGVLVIQGLLFLHGKDCYNRPANERLNPLGWARNPAPAHHLHLGQAAGSRGQQAHPFLWDRGAGRLRDPGDRHRGGRYAPGDP